MAMNEDIRLHVGFFQHPKTVKLKRKMGADGVMALLQLWTWAAIHSPSGTLRGDALDMAIAAEWEGDEEELVSTLIDVGWLKEIGTGYKINDWEKHNPYAAKAEERSNRSRLGCLCKHDPELGEKLKASGVRTLSPEQKDEIVDEINRAKFLSGEWTPDWILVNSRNTRPIREHYETTTSRPSPSPVPSPVPVPEEQEGSNEPMSAQADAAPQEPSILERVRTLWNEKLKEHDSNLPPSRPISPSSKRAKWIRARLKEFPDWADWETCFTNAATSAFLNARTAKAWTGCSLDWVLRPTNFPKVLEGNFNRDGGSAGPGSGKFTPSGEHLSLKERLAAAKARREKKNGE